MTIRHRRPLAIGGIIAPAAFVAAWTIGGMVTSRQYSPIDDPISRLAAVGAPTRALMTGGFVIFGVGMAAFARALKSAVTGPAWITALGTGVATLLVAATPLDASARIDQLHGIFAGAGYVTLAATPALAAAPLLASGRTLIASLGICAASISAVALALTTTALPTGLMQRIGLTVTDAWIVGVAVSIVAGRMDRA